MAIKTTDLEREVINALFRQEKPIIFSMKAGLEKLGKGHHKTSHMNRTQHSDALMKGLDFRGNKTKQDWSEGDLWSRVIDFANKKKPLNDIRLNKIWEEVKRIGSWDEERFKGIETAKERVWTKGGYRSEVKEVPGPVPEGPAPRPPEKPEPDKLLIKKKDDRIAELEKRNRELLNELQEYKRVDKKELGERTTQRDSYKEEARDYKIRLAFYEAGKEGRTAELKEEFDPGSDDQGADGGGTFRFVISNPNWRGEYEEMSMYNQYILLGIEDEIILFDMGTGTFYDKDARAIGTGEISNYNSEIKNVEFNYQPRMRLHYKREDRLRDLPLKTQIKNLNRQIREFEDRGSPAGQDFILGPYGSDNEEIIIEEQPEGSGKYVVVDNDDGETIADWDREKGMINMDEYRYKKFLREREIKENKPQVKEESVRPDGLLDFILKGHDYLLNPKTLEVLEADHLPDEEPDIIGKAIVGEEGDNPDGLDIIKIDFGGITSSDSDSSESEDEDSDFSSDEEVDSEEVQINLVDMVITKISNDEGKKAGFDSELLNEESDYIGFFNNRDDLSGLLAWHDLDDFVWVDSRARQTYLETMRDLMEDEGRGAMIPQVESRVPTKILDKVQDQQIGGMTKGHFHKEVPVILHGGELVIPKKHVAEVMKQSDLAHQISKIPPTWQKIKKIVK
ncbi:hypothetical protein K0U83_23005 [bacterium]|nr:hypothetical protein [bacterium]